ncbi:hypothetical protein C9I99_26795 [Photobacterium lutimaris]|uniref:Uncharacterized protein n=3 Tax=Photobacterium lutimaris TaxID=388278 RepID=A0A2T3IH84_9GAMM|nr:hypothetical protein C9I99_26795 [Photobacterium lutimaris]
MYIIDRGENLDIDGSDIFVPTFENMRTKLKSEFEGELSPKLIDKVMTEEYSEKFREYWDSFNNDISDSGKHWTSSFDTHEAQRFAMENFNSNIDSKKFTARQNILSEIGAWEVFKGDGLTEFNGIKSKPGALEILEIQHMPETIEELITRGKILKVELYK